MDACRSGSANLETPNFALFFIEIVNYGIRYKVFDGIDPERYEKLQILIENEGEAFLRLIFHTREVNFGNNSRVATSESAFIY